MLLLYLRTIMFKKAGKVFSEDEIEKPGDRLQEANEFKSRRWRDKVGTLVVNWSPANVR